MSKALFDEQNEQVNFTRATCLEDNAKKKPRPKFTILDDIDQLNQIINGPGANQQNQKAQQILQKTYQYMKGPEPQQNQNQVNNQKPYASPKDQNVIGSEEKNKQNKDFSNLSKNDQFQCLEDKLKMAKGPRIIVTIKKIDLLKQPTPTQFYVKGLENLISCQEAYGGTRAPRNSVLENQKVQDGNLFTKALYTQRSKNHHISNINVSKPNRQVIQPFIKKQIKQHK